MKVEQTVPLLLVTDLDRSAAFYVEGLGFTMEREWRPDGKLAWCWLQHAGGAALMLQRACDEDPPPPWGPGVTFYFLCDDASEVHAELVARGVDATEPEVAFYGMEQTFVTDPDGYTLCFENPTES